MTDKLKTLAEEAKRFDGGDWFLFQHLIDHWSMDKQDAAYIAAVSPDVVLGLLAERDALRADAAQLRTELATANERHAGLMLAVVDRDMIIKQYAAAMKRGEA